MADTNIVIDGGVTKALGDSTAALDAATKALDASRATYESKAAAYDSKLEAQATEIATLKSELEAVQTKLNRTGSGKAEVTRDHAERPFDSFGEQLKAIANAELGERKVDERLIALNTKAASGGSALVGGDGGFLIQTDFSSAIFRSMHDTASLYPLCDKHQVSGNADGLEVPYIDETSRATGSRWGGVQVYRAGESDDVTSKKPKIGKMETRLEDLRGLAYMTDRLLRDAAAMSSIYQSAFSEEFAWVIDNEIMHGTGAAQCLGVTVSPALISVSKETGQLADTFVFENAVKMLARLHTRSMKGAKWFINQDVWPQLLQMNVALGTSGQMVFLPPGGASAAPYGTLFGLPVVPVEQAKTVGDLGDVVLANLGQYQLVEKGGLEAASSIHVRFINHENTFRWNWSINGQPKWKTAVTPANGTATVSPFVALAARA
jgi:HK97 family phage major capsid protein